MRPSHSTALSAARRAAAEAAAAAAEAAAAAAAIAAEQRAADAEQRRQDRAAAAEQRRQDRAAAAEQRRRDRQAATEQRRQDRARAASLHNLGRQQLEEEVFQHCKLQKLTDVRTNHLSIGLMRHICGFCGAKHFLCEKTGGTMVQPVFSNCCYKGKVQLPPIRQKGVQGVPVENRRWQRTHL